MSTSQRVQNDLAAWYSRENAELPLAEVTRLGLTRYATELDNYGFTVIPPEATKAAPGFVEELRRAILRSSVSKGSDEPDLVTGKSHPDSPQGSGQHMFYMLLEGDVFERALMNECVLAIADHCVGNDCLLGGMSSMVKGPGNVPLRLHADTAFVPQPLASYAQVVNCTWILSDYNKENGALCFWPGSHKICRQPTQEEAASTHRFVPVTAPAGSLLVWHGNTWHAAFARSAPGLRINLIMYFTRMYMTPQEDYRDKISADALRRNGKRFARLLQFESPFPFVVEGPDFKRYEQMGARARARQEY